MPEKFLNPGDVLTKTTSYQLDRGGRRVYLDIHEVVAHCREEQPRFRFYGVPHLGSGGTRQKYVSGADSAAEALAQCLENLQHADLLDIPEQSANMAEN